jgi:hypothetical protein
MNLSQSEIELFYKLWYGIVWGINEKYGVIPHFKKPVYGKTVTVSIEEFTKIRNAMWDNPNWIDEFLADNDNGEFTELERSIIVSWRRNFVKDKFIVIKHFVKYSVLMPFDDESSSLYGVCGISDSIKDTFPYPLPFVGEFVLLPFKDKIIYDSIAPIFNISFGPGFSSSAKKWYSDLKLKHGITEILNGEDPKLVQSSEKAKKKSLRKSTKTTIPNLPNGVKVPKAMTMRYVEIADIIADFCNKKLDEEYKEICLRSLAKLCRKRPSPLVSGQAKTWAGGIVYAIGQNNFIFDKTQPFNMTAGEIADRFSLSKSTIGSKANEIRKILKISHFDKEFSRKELADAGINEIFGLL